MARPSKPHRCTWNQKEVHGLYKCPDGRWRVVSTGQKFSEPDERKAIERFLKMTGQAIETVDLPIATADGHEIHSADNDFPTQSEIALAASLTSDIGDDGKIKFLQRVPKETLYAWMRQALLDNLDFCAEMTGLRGLRLLDLTGGGKAVSIEAVRDLYDRASESNWRTKGQVKAAMNRLAQVTDATNLEDLTTEKLIAFREKVNADLAQTGAQAVYGKIKSALAFAQKHGSLDAGQLSACLSRMKVLYAGKAQARTAPTPITPDDFGKLLKHADSKWRAILLLALNGGLYAEDVCTLQWKDFDLAARTYSGIRAKTSIVRIMSLWPETVAAIKALPRKADSPYLLTSQTGTRFMATTLYDAYKTLREKAGVSTPFSGIRDAGYTIACEHCTDTVARMFAAHKAAGLQDNYVARKPHIVKPAATAIRKVFAPFADREN